MNGPERSFARSPRHYGLAQSASRWQPVLMATELNAEKLSAMSVSQRLRLLEEVWASLADRREALTIPDWHRDELDVRLEAHKDDPSAASP